MTTGTYLPPPLWYLAGLLRLLVGAVAPREVEAWRGGLKQRSEHRNAEQLEQVVRQLA